MWETICGWNGDVQNRSFFAPVLALIKLLTWCARTGRCLPYAFKTPFVGCRLRVSDFFFLGHRLSHVVMLSPSGDFQFHPAKKIYGVSGFSDSRFLNTSIVYRKIMSVSHFNQNFMRRLELHTARRRYADVIMVAVAYRTRSRARSRVRLETGVTLQVEKPS